MVCHRRLKENIKHILCHSHITVWCQHSTQWHDSMSHDCNMTSCIMCPCQQVSSPPVCVVTGNSSDTCVCNEGFTLCGGSCWHFAPRTVFLNFTDAQEYCSSLGAQMAFPTSLEENSCANCLTKEVAGAWLSVRGENTTESFQGPDGQLTYANWADDQPFFVTCLGGVCDNCLLMQPAGTWWAYPCSFSYYVLCQQR